MAITEISIIHHVAMVIFLLWMLNEYSCCHPLFYFVSLIYLYQVHERYIMRLSRKLQFEERKQANQRRVLVDKESVRWLNCAVEKMWPICMEEIVSQKILLPIVPWFLEKYKPWTVKKAEVQHLYLGRNPPMFTDMRVFREPTDDDHLVLELGLNFLTADDMSAILAAKLRKRLGFGMSTKLHLTSMHVEGKVLVGVKFTRHWPFISRLRVCFAEPPYFQMNVKPIFSHGLDVTELPGIAGWLDNLLAVAFEQTLVEPNMLVVDLEKFVSPEAENWFSMDVKEPVAYARVEVIEASDMKPSDFNGLADPYVKGNLGPYRFKTKIQKKTLSPKWQEEYKIPICSWESNNVLNIEVRDKDHLVDDRLGVCSVDITTLRDGQRHDMWMALGNVKVGRLRLAITVVETNGKAMDAAGKDKKPDIDDQQNSPQPGTSPKLGSSSSNTSLKTDHRVTDTYEAIDIQGQDATGIWVHHPGSEVSQRWEPRKGKKTRQNIDTQNVRGRDVGEDSVTTLKSSSGRSLLDDTTSSNDTGDGNNKPQRFKFARRGLQKINSALHRNHNKREDEFNSFLESSSHSPRPNVTSINTTRIGVNLIVEDSLCEEPLVVKEEGAGGSSSNDGSGAEGGSSTRRAQVKGMAKNIFKQAGKSAKDIKQALSNKGSKYFLRSPGAEGGNNERGFNGFESDSSENDSLSSSVYNDSSVEGISILSKQQATKHGDADSFRSQDGSDPRVFSHHSEPAKEEELRTSNYSEVDNELVSKEASHTKAKPLQESIQLEV